MQKVAWMRTFTAAIIMVGLTGCVSYKSEKQTSDADIPDLSFLNQITLGETRTGWLIEQFGHPSAVRRPNEDAAVWQYENVTRSSTQVRALPLFAVELKNLSRTIYNFEIENDYVVRYWKDDITD